MSSDSLQSHVWREPHTIRHVVRCLGNRIKLQTHTQPPFSPLFKFTSSLSLSLLINGGGNESKTASSAEEYGVDGEPSPIAYQSAFRFGLQRRPARTCTGTRGTRRRYSSQGGYSFRSFFFAGRSLSQQKTDYKTLSRMYQTRQRKCPYMPSPHSHSALSAYLIYEITYKKIDC